MSGGRKIDQMKAAIAANRQKAGEPAAQKLVNPMPIGRRPKKVTLPETDNVPPSERRPKLPSCDRKDAKMSRRGRLPEGSVFDVNWDGKRWAGSLTVPYGTGEEAVFEAEASGVFRLLANLDAEYRRWAKEAKLCPPLSS